jgi:uncharacterized protein (TIGR03435 family)
MKPSTVDCNAWRAMQRQQIEARGDGPISEEEYARYYLQPACAMVHQPFRARIGAGHITMAELARFLSRLPALRSPVIDRTGLTGAFDFELVYAPALGAGAADRSTLASVEPPPPSLLIALEEQLGLKLESDRGPVDVLVIDRVELPSEN